MKLVVTGARGLLGWHTSSRLYAANCAARFRGEPTPYELIFVDRSTFADAASLAEAVAGANAVLHFAGINRGSDEMIATGNPAIARALTDALALSGSRPHVVYANSIQARDDSVYGRSKREAADILSKSGPLTNVFLPHIFGECARPDYNNVTATLIDRLWKGEVPVIHEGATVELLHVGCVADIFIRAAVDGRGGDLTPRGRPISVNDLWAMLENFHEDYSTGVFPPLERPFDIDLFNCYRTGGFPHHAPIRMNVRADQRGRLFETSKARSGSQTFVSTTAPGQLRGDHFHLSLVERFLVVSGEAVIRVRRILTNEVHEFRVSGTVPVAIDMPPLHTHHIENDGPQEVVTLFWANRIFDPASPDTYAEPVLQ